jgi:hypothetical protein
MKISGISNSVLIGVISAFFCSCQNENQRDDYSNYNVIWESQSKNSSESMPVGGYDIGCNAWVEDGSIYYYFGRSNGFDENNALLKSGRIKVDINPNPFVTFRQELKLKNGYVIISGEDGDLRINARLWSETDRPLIHFEIESNREVTVTAEYQNWRINKTPIISRWVVPSYIDYPGEDIFWFPDTVKTVKNDVIFYHQNNNDHLVLDKEIMQQDLVSMKDEIWNPLKDFIFGGVLRGTGMEVTGTVSGNYLSIPYKGIELQTKEKTKECRIDILLHSDYYNDSREFEDELGQALSSFNSEFQDEFTRHQNWWKNFWDKSWIRINNDPADPADPAWQVGRNYNIFRYQMACNTRGEYPTKLNGGLFTYDPVLVREEFRTENPDFRAWGGGVMTAQNQRLLYWPLLKTGDFPLMPQQFNFYRRALPTAELRTKYYWGHEGGCFTDQMNQAGIVCGREYGWNRLPGTENGVQWSPYHEYYFTSQLEFAYMIIEYYRYSGKDIAAYMPFVKSAIRFFDDHYRFRAKQNFGQEFTEDGKYIFYPCMALETYTGNVKNPSDVIAALNVLTRDLQKLPEKYVSRAEKDYYAEMKSRLPQMPTREMNGFNVISPAETWDKIINQEIPQLYPVFPWGLFGIGKPDLDLAVHTWEHGIDEARQKNHISWHQDAIFCARMGLIEEAKNITIKKLSDSQRRFPTFWGPGHDWVPDHNWGGSGMIGLQEMLMQTTGDEIRLLAAWPEEWDVDFRLHAPNNTIVEGYIRDGVIQDLKVTPESRLADVIIGEQDFHDND